jgi:hypothetical protein
MPYFWDCDGMKGGKGEKQLEQVFSLSLSLSLSLALSLLLLCCLSLCFLDAII